MTRVMPNNSVERVSRSELCFWFPRRLRLRPPLTSNVRGSQLIAVATVAAQPAEPKKGKDKMKTRKLGSLEVSESASAT